MTYKFTFYSKETGKAIYGEEFYVDAAGNVVEYYLAGDMWRMRARSDVAYTIEEKCKNIN